VYINEKNAKKILPLAGGKGGTGVSLLAVNTALRLAANGKRTCLIDLDLGTSNLHTYLGLKNNRPGIGNYLSSRKYSFEDIISAEVRDNLSFIPGDVLVSGIGSLTPSQMSKIEKAVLSLDYEYIIADIGNGVEDRILSFLLMSDSPLIVCKPSPASLVNAYSLVKNLFFFHLLRLFKKKKKVETFIKKTIKEETPGSMPDFIGVLAALSEIDSEAAADAEKAAGVLHPMILFNVSEGPDDITMYEDLSALVKKNTGIQTECLGIIFRDDALGESSRTMQPFVETNQGGLPFSQIERICQKILQSSDFPQMPLDFDLYNSSAELARIEAENDIEYLKSARRNSFEKEEADPTDFLAIIGSQKQEIAELKSTIRRLTIGK
jgi:flagellar biosynthesis protein FlhG